MQKSLDKKTKKITAKHTFIDINRITQIINLLFFFLYYFYLLTKQNKMEIKNKKKKKKIENLFCRKLGAF